MPTDITKKQMVEWLKQQKESCVLDAELRGDHSENYERDIGMYDAILAALAERTGEKGGVNGLERKGLLDFFDALSLGVRENQKKFYNDEIWGERVVKCNKIRAILGNQGGAVTEKARIERLKEILMIAEKLGWIYPLKSIDLKDFSYPLMQLSEVEKCVLAMVNDEELEKLRRWSREAGVAGKEGR
jgi:hypothetical protein